MFRNSIIILAVLFVLNLGINAQTRTWNTFTPANGAWSILAPGTLNPDEEAKKSNSRRGSFSYNDFNGFFAVLYTDHSKLNFLPWKKGHFAKQRDLVIKANNAKLINDVEFTSGGIVGREVRLRMPDNRTFSRESSLRPQNRVLRFRMFFQGNRFYTILATVPESDVSSPEIDKYFNSFVLK